MSNDKSAATFHPHVGLQDAPVLDRPACQTYPTAKGGAVCGEPATLKVSVVHCPIEFPDDEPQVIDVCLPCWRLGGEGVIRHRPCQHTSPRDDVWAVAS